MGTKFTEAVTEKLPKGEILDLSEVGEGKPVEVMSERDILKAGSKKFANDILTIMVHDSSDDGSLEIITPSVNAMNQPIVRGIESKVKRKYVEVLARTRTTKYDQTTPDTHKPHNIKMVERTVLTYPFVVLHDPHPDGREWLKAILAQA